MKAVQQYINSHDTKIGFIIGMISGMIKYVVQTEPSFWLRLGESALIALICGAAGVIGKDMILLVKRKLKPRK